MIYYIIFPYYIGFLPFYHRHWRQGYCYFVCFSQDGTPSSKRFDSRTSKPPKQCFQTHLSHGMFLLWNDKYLSIILSNEMDYTITSLSVLSQLLLYCTTLFMARSTRLLISIHLTCYPFRAFTNSYTYKLLL